MSGKNLVVEMLNRMKEPWIVGIPPFRAESVDKAIRLAELQEQAVELLEDAVFDIDTAGIDLESVNRNIYRRAREILSAID